MNEPENNLVDIVKLDEIKENPPRFLADPEMPPEKSKELLEDANEALSIMGRYLPKEAIPVEPTLLLFENLSSGNSAYVGKLGGKHYIRICSSSENESTRKERLDRIYTMTHEFLHQRTMEVVGLQNFYGVNLDELYSKKPNTASDSERDKFNFMMETAGGPTSILTDAVGEGIAVLGELAVLKGLIADAQKVGDKEALETYEEFRKNRFDSFNKTHLYYKKGKAVCPDEYSLGIFGIMKPLYRIFGAENLIPLVKSIDYSALRKISKFPDQRRILMDPLLIPGLDKSPLVIAWKTTQNRSADETNQAEAA